MLSSDSACQKCEQYLWGPDPVEGVLQSCCFPGRASLKQLMIVKKLIRKGIFYLLFYHCNRGFNQLIFSARCLWKLPCLFGFVFMKSLVNCVPSISELILPLCHIHGRQRPLAQSLHNESGRGPINVSIACELQPRYLPNIWHKVITLYKHLIGSQATMHAHRHS